MGDQNHSNFSLVSLDTQPLSETANLLINKLSNAIGWIATFETSERKARRTFIEAVQNNPQLDALEKAAYIADHKKIIREFRNQYDIVKLAINDLHGATADSINCVDDSWLAYAMDRFRLVNSDDLKRLWAKILAQECTVPNSISKYLLSIVDVMDTYLAKSFTLLKSHSIYTDDDNPCYVPVIFLKNHEQYFDNIGLTFSTLTDLESIGLISFNSFRGFSFRPTKEHIQLRYGNRRFIIDTADRPEIPSGNVMFTHSGEQLCQVIEADEIDDFIQHCLPDLKIEYHQI